MRIRQGDKKSILYNMV